MNRFHLLFTHMFCLIGSLVLTISSLSAQRSAETIKILAVGNSFSDDGVEYLDELARAAGIKLIIGNLYIGGARWNATGIMYAMSFRLMIIGKMSKGTKPTHPKRPFNKPYKMKSGIISPYSRLAKIRGFTTPITPISILC